MCSDHFLSFEVGKLTVGDKWNSRVEPELAAVDFLGFGQLHEALAIAPKANQ